MKFSINNKKHCEEINRNEKIKGIAKISVFVFSMCALTLILFFGAIEGVGKIEYGENSEYQEVFKDLGIYDFLELDECENEKTSGEVSEFDNLGTKIGE